MDKKIEETLDDLRAILESRSKYNPEGSPFRTMINTASRMDMKTTGAIEFMIEHKMSRLKNIEPGIAAYDTLMDIAGYAIIGASYISHMDIEKRTTMLSDQEVEATVVATSSKSTDQL